jgi:hypothetical protein
MVRDAGVACEATLQPMRRFPLDAAIVFSDLLVPLEGLGHAIHYGDHGPEVADGPNSAKEATTLARFESNDAVEVPGRTLALLTRELPPKVARIGFAGAPWTLGLYLLEGKGSKGFEKARARALTDELPAPDGISPTRLPHYTKLQIAGGAQVISCSIHEPGSRRRRSSAASSCRPRRWSRRSVGGRAGRLVPTRLGAPRPSRSGRAPTASRSTSRSIWRTSRAPSAATSRCRGTSTRRCCSPRPRSPAPTRAL